VEALVIVRDTSIQPLLKGLRDDRQGTRDGMAKALGEIGMLQFSDHWWQRHEGRGS
jgi:hypothetical protein